MLKKYTKLFVSVALSLASGAHICAMQSQEEKDALGRYAGMVKSVEELRDHIARGANINVVSEVGTPLMMFAAFGELEMLKEALRNGAEVNIQGGPGHSSALMNAAWDGWDTVAQELIQAGADIYAKDDCGETALVSAAYLHWGTISIEGVKDRINIARMILEKATKLTPEDKEVVKTWLLVNQRLRQEKQVFLPKDPRTIVVKKIYESLSETLRERVIRAGGLLALEVARRVNFEPGFIDHVRLRVEMIQLLEKYLDLKFLEQRVREQLPRKL